MVHGTRTAGRVSRAGAVLTVLAAAGAVNADEIEIDPTEQCEERWDPDAEECQQFCQTTQARAQREAAIDSEMQAEYAQSPAQRGDSDSGVGNGGNGGSGTSFGEWLDDCTANLAPTDLLSIGYPTVGLDSIADQICDAMEAASDDMVDEYATYETRELEGDIEYEGNVLEFDETVDAEGTVDPAGASETEFPDDMEPGEVATQTPDEWGREQVEAKEETVEWEVW